jgi:addiction module HigA family antidote
MFERKRRPSTPGDILRAHYLDERGISVAALGRAIDISRKHMSDIVNGRSRIEPAVAARLAKVFGTSTALWLNLQAAVDAWDADREARSWKPLQRFSDAAD